MKDKKALTEAEQKVMDFLTKAHNAYCELQKSEHFGREEAADWAFHMRALQARIGMRILARDYPHEFSPA